LRAISRAGQELLSANFFCSFSPIIRTPLMAVVDYWGYRLLATALLPLNESSLLYGRKTDAFGYLYVWISLVIPSVFLLLYCISFLLFNSVCFVSFLRLRHWDSQSGSSNGGKTVACDEPILGYMNDIAAIFNLKSHQIQNTFKVHAASVIYYAFNFFTHDCPFYSFLRFISSPAHS
jgi:hypothetical protein